MSYGNGVYDYGEDFEDEENGEYDVGEDYIDYNNNGIRDFYCRKDGAWSTYTSTQLDIGNYTNQASCEASSNTWEEESFTDGNGVRDDNEPFIDAPIYIQIGELDNWTPASACENFVYETKKYKDNIDITVYPDSHHGFDTEIDIEFIEHAYSFSDCMFDISDEGAILMNYLKIPMTSPLLQKIGFSFCVERGTYAGGNIIAREKAFQSSKAFISKHLLEFK